MKDLRSLSDQQILHQAKSLAVQERQLTAELLLFLREVERRRLFARSYGTLFEYVTKELGYSDSSAARRINSMRLLKDLPEVEEKIKEGSLNLSQIAQAQRFFQNEVKNNNPINVEKKREILSSLVGKSTRDTERELLSKSSNPAPLIHDDKIRPVTESLSEVKFVANKELLGLLEEVKGLLSHIHPNLTMAELISESAKLALAALKAKKFKVRQNDLQSQKVTAGAAPKVSREVAKAKQKIEKSEMNTKVHTVETFGAEVKGEGNTAERLTTAGNANGKSRSRYIPAEVKRAVYLRDQGMCTHVDPASGRRCSAKTFLEYDHAVAFAKNGDASVHNLSLKCKTHNILHAMSDFGQSHVAKFVPSLR